MKRDTPAIILIGLFALLLASEAPAGDGPGGLEAWKFDVYLNDKKVGEHSFSVTEKSGVKQVRSEAEFKYRVFFIPAYRYKHSAAERWSGDCLIEFDASTNANGKRTQITGQKTGDIFRVEANDQPVELPECVMTFAYWNPAFLDQSSLLNPQTGEYVDVNVEQIGVDSLEVRGQPVTANRFQLTADETELTLWYSTDNEWLALESVVKGGHIIRYELS
jgi:hypothetical protein